MKVLTIVGTRPEIIKMSRVIDVFDEYTDHILAHTGQNYDYELNKIFFDKMNIREPDYFMNCADNTSVRTIANIIKNTEKIIKECKPDCILIYGDTNSCFSALAAKKNKVPIFHMEAGNRCFDINVPEEINRKVIDHLSDINLVLTEQARHYLQKEGFDSQRIIKTGSHMAEIIQYYSSNINKSNILKKYDLNKKKFFVVSFHREENVDNKINLKKFISSILEIEKKFKFKIIFSVHPRTRNRIEKLQKNFFKNKNIIFSKPFSFIDYLKLCKNSFCVLSDSGTITEESTILNFPAVNLRNTHERPEGDDYSYLIMSGLEKNNIVDSINTVVKIVAANKNNLIPPDYMNKNVSFKILKVVKSYTSYVNEQVWKK
tara:strand:+ start:94 stop:1215 length:1122 start_codon:yes stop_codon:yes gene_type:complete